MKNAIPLIISTLLVSTLVSGQSKKAQAKYEKGVAQNKVGILIDASLLFTEAIEEFPEYSEAYYQRALSFDGMGQRAHAIQDLEKATVLKIENIQAYLLLIRWYKQDESYDKALGVTDRIIKQLPDNTAGAYYDQGLIYDRTKKLRKALDAYKNALKHVDADMKDFKQLLRKRIKDIEAEL